MGNQHNKLSCTRSNGEYVRKRQRLVNEYTISYIRQTTNIQTNQAAMYAAAPSAQFLPVDCGLGNLATLTITADGMSILSRYEGKSYTLE